MTYKTISLFIFIRETFYYIPKTKIVGHIFL